MEAGQAETKIRKKYAKFISTSVTTPAKGQQADNQNCWYVPYSDVMYAVNGNRHSVIKL